jgi:hypothetical protein
MHILYAGTGLHLPAHFSPINFPIGNAATGFFVIFAVIAGVVGAGSALAGLNHVRAWSTESLPAAASAGFIAWTLTLLAMGYVRYVCRVPRRRVVRVRVCVCWSINCRSIC